MVRAAIRNIRTRTRSGSWDPARSRPPRPSRRRLWNALQGRVRHGDALGVHADRRAHVLHAARGIGPGAAGVSRHRRVRDGQDSLHVVAGEEEAAAERLGPGGVVEDGVPTERDVEGISVAVDRAAVSTGPDFVLTVVYD